MILPILSLNKEERAINVLILEIQKRNRFTIHHPQNKGGQVYNNDFHRGKFLAMIQRFLTQS